MTLTSVTSFSGELTARVGEHLTDELLRDAHARLHRKAVVVGTWYVSSYVLVLLANGWWRGMLACLSLALSMVAVGFNVQHDANHNAFFPTGGRRRLTWANRLAGLSINMLGGSSKRWIDGHVNLHHVSPNVVGKDYDIELPPFARLAPSQRRHPWHAFQHLYLWAIYGFTTVGIMLGDVVGTVQESIAGDRKGKSPTFKDYLALVGSKGAFAAAMLVIPLMRHPWWVVLLGVVAVMGISGWLLGIVFQLAHVVEETDFGDAADDRESRWHEWQVRTSVDFCHGPGLMSRAVTWYCGGLNYQTEHHLFPAVPHTAYPAIAPIVAETCAEFGVPYHVQPTLRAAIGSHYRHVRGMGRAEPISGPKQP